MGLALASSKRRTPNPTFMSYSDAIAATISTQETLGEAYRIFEHLQPSRQSLSEFGELKWKTAALANY